jgi:hypothetical protein
MNIIAYEATTGDILSKEMVEQPSRSATLFKCALTLPYIMVA